MPVRRYAGRRARTCRRRDRRSGTTALVAALDATDGLDVAWARLPVGAVAADQDERPCSASTTGSSARPPTAAGRQVRRGAQAARPGRRRARSPRGRSATSSSRRSTSRSLDEWIDRNAAYDTALAQPVQAHLRSKGKVTDSDPRRGQGGSRPHARGCRRTPAGLVIIMADIGRGGLNGAVIAIEEARGKLATRSTAMRRRPAMRPAASGTPAAADSPPPTSAP